MYDVRLHMICLWEEILSVFDDIIKPHQHLYTLSDMEIEFSGETLHPNSTVMVNYIKWRTLSLLGLKCITYRDEWCNIWSQGKEKKNKSGLILPVVSYQHQ